MHSVIVRCKLDSEGCDSVCVPCVCVCPGVYTQLNNLSEIINYAIVQPSSQSISSELAEQALKQP